MGTILNMVTEKLRDAGIRSDEAYPGSRIPALTGPVAAVKLGKVDRSVRTTTVLVTVMSPAKSGGSICETTALGAVEALQEMGGTCIKDICRFDEMADVCERYEVESIPCFILIDGKGEIVARWQHFDEGIFEMFESLL